MCKFIKILNVHRIAIFEWNIVRMLTFMMEKTQREKKYYEHQNNEGEKRISNTNKFNPYILPSIHRLQNPLLIRMRCMEGEQWRRQQKRRREKEYKNVMYVYQGHRPWQIWSLTYLKESDFSDRVGRGLTRVAFSWVWVRKSNLRRTVLF